MTHRASFSLGRLRAAFAEQYTVQNARQTVLPAGHDRHRQTLLMDNAHVSEGAACNVQRELLSAASASKTHSTIGAGILRQSRWEHNPASSVSLPAAVQSFYRGGRLDLSPSLTNPGQSSLLQEPPFAVDFDTSTVMSNDDTEYLCNFYLDALPAMPESNTGPISTFSSGQPAAEPHLLNASYGPASTLVRTSTQALPQQQRPHSALECRHPTRPSALALQVGKIGSSLNQIDAGAAAGDANTAL